MHKQQTIKGKIILGGKGLHTGKETKIEIFPAPANSGIIFMRKDIVDAPLIKGDVYSVLAPEKFPRRTSVGLGNNYVHTVEHLMAAFHLLGIDNVQVNVWGEEIPGLDGSAKGFVDRIKEVGIEKQNLEREYLTIREPLWVGEGSSSIVILPYPSLHISYALKYDNPLIGSSYVDVELNGELKTNIYEARTFCLEEEVKPLLDIGLGKGANYGNTLVVAKEGIVENKLRFADEFVKHKVLDLIGDLYLVGPFKGYVVGIKSGHTLNIRLLEKLRRYKDKMKSSGVSSQTQYVPEGTELNAQEIMKILPHRYPFLLVDKILHLEKGRKATALKSVTINEYFFQGHFPAKPVMPGVLIVEAMAQVGGILMLACEEHRGKLAYFLAANAIKFRKTVEPGDQLFIDVTAGKVKSKTGVVYGKAYVNDKLVAEAELMFALTSK